MDIQLNDNVKARWLDNDLSNNYVPVKEQHKIRSQIEIYNYLHKKTLRQNESIVEATS
jgi:polyphosphate kinase